MKNNIIYIIAVLTIISCTQSSNYEKNSTSKKVIEEKHIPSEKAISLNDSAVKLLMQITPFQDSSNSKLNKKALIYLNKAIKEDSIYQLAYSNKVDVLKNLGRYDEAIKTLNTATRLISGYAEAYSAQAFLYEKTGQLDSANLMYIKATNAYKKRINREPNNINHQINLAFLLLFTEGKTEALYEIEGIIEKTDNEQAIEFKAVIKSFDREQFITNY